MNAAQLLQIGLHRALSLAMFHQLEQRWLWAAVKGGWRYLSAFAAGQQAGAEAVQGRLLICQACDAIDTVETGRTDLMASYCGKGVTIGSKATCGCLIAVTIQGKPMEAAGKLLISTEGCPRGRWAATSPDSQQGPAPIGDASGR